MNESCLLFVYDVGLGKFRPSKVKSVINPDFIRDGIASEYTDGPMGRREKVCYSNKIKDYYFCEKAEQFSDQLERRKICNELSCAEPEILKQGTSNIVEATISEDKVYLLDKKLIRYLTNEKLIW